jgi:hypothetical protein
MSAHARSLRRSNRRAAAPRHVRPPRRPLRAWLRRLKRRACRTRSLPRLWPFNCPVPYRVSVTSARPKPRARKNGPSNGVIIDQWSRVPLGESGRRECPRIWRITDQQLEGRLGREPTNPANATNTGAPNCHPAMALLIIGSKPDPQRVQTGTPRSIESGTTGARAFKPILEPTGSRAPHMLYSRANEGNQLRDPIERELPRPQSPANGTKPCLAHPSKSFHGQVSGPRANPYRTGHGHPLESPNNSSTRNPRFATRSMGVVGASPLCHGKGQRRGVRTRWRARPDCLN